ncbi:hypothetical protein MSPP1_003994 [Malassezia sp. CBS 17886]|nr:hypothetical protein MSPP1_003994 [Malassezia sp. CBS 17886]
MQQHYRALTVRNEWGMPIRGRGKFPQAKVHEEEHAGVIRKYTVLRRDGHERAIVLLKDVGEAVKALMARHGWELPMLSEMYPRGANLLGLNINHGQKICLRLRAAGDADAFLSRQEILATHNVRGPHDTVFYRTLRDLTAEYDEAQQLGYWPGAGFLSEGLRLGGTAFAPLQLSERRRRAADKVQERAGARGSAGRLGGRAGDRTMRELAAEAALQRMRDAETCASALPQEDMDKIISDADDSQDGRPPIIVIDDDEETSAPRRPTPVPPRPPETGRSPHDPIILSDSD